MVQSIPEIDDCQVDLASATLTIHYQGDAPDLAQLDKVVRASGHQLVTSKQRSPAGERSALLGFAHFLASDRNTILTAAGGILTLVGLVILALGALASAPQVGLSTILFAAAILVGGAPVVRRAGQEIWLSRQLGINTLMVIAVCGATLIGEWAEAAVVVSLFSLGEALEGYASDRARYALDSLLDLAPPVALRIEANGETIELPVESLQVGDNVLVRPGDRISADGIVDSGESTVDQASITGESIPVEKGPGSEVFAGTINGAGALRIRVSRPTADNTLNRMVALVQQAQSRRAPVERFIDRFARVYTPAVAATATLVATLPPLLFGAPFWGPHGWLMRALQMLVIACPCALVISTPVSVVSAMTNAATRGVLIKGGRYLDVLSRVRVVALDKTGTLTEGRPVATDILHVCTCGQCPENCGLQHAAALEAQSSHPLAQALLSEARQRQLPLAQAENVTNISGQGLAGTVNGSQVTVASHAHFDRHYPHDASICEQANALAAAGKTVIMVQHDNQVCGLFGVADSPRPESAAAIAALKAQGLVTVMLTGDGATVAAEIGRKVGVDQVIAELLPAEKMAAIEQLATRHQVVAMVGDGVNDAPALAQADVGIAMGGAGSAQAMETADVVLMGDDLTQLSFVRRLALQTRRIVTTNIVFALATKAVIFALAAGGLASLWLAIVADVGTSVAVILNGMRLRNQQYPD